MRATTQCASCGSDRLEDAQLESTAIRLTASSTMKKIFNVGGQVFCRVCLGCGALHDLRGDPKALAAMLE